RADESVEPALPLRIRDADASAEEGEVGREVGEVECGVAHPRFVEVDDAEAIADDHVLVMEVLVDRYLGYRWLGQVSGQGGREPVDAARRRREELGDQGGPLDRVV